MPELFTLLQAEHDRAWGLMNSLNGGAGDDPHGAQQRRRIARELVRLLAAHEFSEELVIWPIVARDCTDGAELAQVALDQEHQLKLALNELSSISPSQEFDECVNTVASRMRTHLSYEQSQVWPRLDDALSDGRLEELRGQWERVRAVAATKPHPHLPADPRWLGAAMPALSTSDSLARAVRARVSAIRS